MKASIKRTVAEANALRGIGIGTIAIMPNDTDTYPEDSFDNMKVFAAQHRFTFPYVIDASQEVARLLKAMPDLRIEVQQRYASQNAVIVEVIISGHHLGAWRGLPPTGRPVRFPLCGIFVFDNEDRLAGEKIYYDRATVLRQLGIFLEPDHGLGRIATIITHPITMARTILRMALARRRS